MESTIGLHKTELIKKDGPWRSLADVELATSAYVNWSHTRCDRTPPSATSRPPSTRPPTTLKPSLIQRLESNI